MRAVKRPRRYLAPTLLVALSPVFEYNHPRDAYVLRMVGRHVGPVLCQNRRVKRGQPSDGVDRRRRASLA